MSSPVQYSSDGVVSTIAIDDGKANALSVAVLGEINAALDRAEAEKTVVVIRGRQGILSGGFDLAVFKQERAAQIAMLTAGANLTARLLAFPAPTLIACTGHAIAMGAFLLLSADVRIGMSGMPFKIAVNEVAIGMTLPYFAIEVCRQRLSPARFNYATTTGDAHTHEQAREAGFLDEIVPAAEFDDTVRAKALALSKLVREAHTATKLRVRSQSLAALRQAIASDTQSWSVAR
jgi:enoyl-CoA hydratase